MTLVVPSSLYADLQELAATEQTDVTGLLVQLVARSRGTQRDPVFDLIGAYRSTVPLIDNIPVREDPELYAAAEALGEPAHTWHAWQIAPQRYTRGPEGQAVRRHQTTEMWRVPPLE